MPDARHVTTNVAATKPRTTLVFGTLMAPPGRLAGHATRRNGFPSHPRRNVVNVTQPAIRDSPDSLSISPLRGAR